MVPFHNGDVHSITFYKALLNRSDLAMTHVSGLLLKDLHRGDRTHTFWVKAEPKKYPPLPTMHTLWLLPPANSCHALLRQQDTLKASVCLTSRKKVGCQGQQHSLKNLWEKKTSMMESYLTYSMWKGEKDNPESYSNFYRYNLYLSFSRWERWHTRNGSLNSSVKPGKLASCCASHLSLILRERATERWGQGDDSTGNASAQKSMDCLYANEQIRLD